VTNAKRFMTTRPDVPLPRRERQILDAIYQMGEATVAGVLAEIPDPPSYSSVRAILRLMEEKGLVRHKKQGKRYVYRPTRSHRTASHSALQHLLWTFFDGSIENTVVALLGMAEPKLSKEELDRIAKLIEDAKKANP